MALTKEEAREVKGYLVDAFTKVSLRGEATSPPSFSFGIGAVEGNKGFCVVAGSQDEVTAEQKKNIHRWASRAIGRETIEEDIRFTTTGKIRALGK